jgi:integrase
MLDASSSQPSPSGNRKPPSYRKHKATGQAVVTLNGRDHYLGKHATKASRDAYDRLIAEWLGNGRQLPSAGQAVTVAGVIKAYWPHVKNHYRRADGTETSEVSEYVYALRPLNYLYGTLPAADFGPLKFKAIRELMVRGYDHPKYGTQGPLCRGVINKRMDRIRRMFKWAAENEIVQPSIYHGLLAVRGLQRGRTEAYESDPVRPAPEYLIDTTRPYLSRQVQALIDLQLLTGARPGELCIMRGSTLDITGRIWVYRPDTHKTAHHGHRREIYLGPRAQDIVKPFLKTQLDAYLFNPQEAEAERLRIMRQNRKSRVQPSQFRRKKKNPKHKPGDHYDVKAYARAIARACAQAFPLPPELTPKVKLNGQRETAKEWRARLIPEEKEAVKQWRKEHHFHPHQLRHNAGTRLRKEHGVELARIILGHATAFTTEIYAEADRQQAMEVIGKVG